MKIDKYNNKKKYKYQWVPSLICFKYLCHNQARYNDEIDPCVVDNWPSL